MSNQFFNSLFSRGNPQANNALNVANIVNQVRTNPAQLPQLLLNNNRINQQQYNDLQQFNGNINQIANYLVANGLLKL